MIKPKLNGERVSKLLVNTQVTIKLEQGWSERTLFSATYAVKALSLMTLGKLTTSILLTLIAH
jgi:hypothetical protein